MLGALVSLGVVFGVMLWLLFDPPFLTWQHSAELTPALERHFTATRPDVEAVRVVHVREYTATCSIARAVVRWPGGEPLTVWAQLYREDDAWTVFRTVTDAEVTPLLAWGQLCARGERPAPEIDPAALPGALEGPSLP